MFTRAGTRRNVRADEGRERRRLWPVLIGLATTAATLTAAIAGVGGTPTPEQFRWTLIASVSAGILAYLTARGEKLAPSAIKRAALAPFRNEERSRARLLERVRSLWIQGFLEPSMHHLARIDLAVRDRPDAVQVDSDWIGAAYRSHDPSIPAGTSAFELFEQADKSLLIMGEPGAGKTTMMLELARDLLDLAEREATHPIPVVFNLASWGKHDESISRWLVNELHRIYKVPPDMGSTWIEGDEILPLLDGLDEVDRDHRPQCVTAINDWHEAHGLLPLAVCTRLQDYERLGERLTLQRAVVIQPLSRRQVLDHLAEAGPGQAWILEALRDDGALWELLESPLLLSVVTLAYQEPEAAPTSTPTVGLEERRRQLFAVYADTMLSRRGRSTNRYSPEQTVQSLAWLARTMVARGESVLQPGTIDPSWLPEPARRLVARRSILIAAAVTTLLGVIVGLVTHPRLAVGFLTWLSYFNLPGIDTVAGWLAGWFTDLDRLIPRGAGAVVGGVLGMVVGVSRARRASVPIPAARAWTSLTRDVAKSSGVGALIGGPIMVALALVFWVLQQVNGGLPDALINALISGAILGTALSCTALFDPSSKHEHADLAPRQLSLGREVVLESLRGAGRGLLLGLLWGLVGWSLLQALFVGRFFELSAGLLLGVTVALTVLAGALGQTLRHAGTLLVLARTGEIPSDIIRFLDFASECLLLRRGSEGYIFIHRLLMDYFAEQKPSDKSVAARGGLADIVRPPA